jgi:hypothetical protein
MKRLFLASLSVLSLSALMATSAVAESRSVQQIVTAASTSARETTVQLSPNDLVKLAYQGHFREQGIPGYAGLSAAYEAGRVNTEDLIQAAIRTGRLSPETLSDAEYSQIVDAKLESLGDG